MISEGSATEIPRLTRNDIIFICYTFGMKLYNTLTRKLEDFKSLNEKSILFYHCGPTVYWIQHIGNLRAMVWADFIRRSLIFFGYTVKFVRNYTDVGHLVSDEDEGEDKMEKGAKREGLTPDEIANKYVAIFEKDTDALNILEPDVKPCATEYISQIIQMVQTLIDKGYAYTTSSAVVYDVSKFPHYNDLNKQNLDKNIGGSGKGTVEDPEKKHFADFNLWVFKKGKHANALQSWSSPWGEGFPGWHIECSVMIKALLGNTIDMHMGGVEHITVHHTNEIAQSEAANGVKFVNYWLHNEHLDVDGRKMAKSEGTSYTLSQITEKGYDPLVLRYFFMSSHYRSKQNFTWEALGGAKETLRKLRETVLALKTQIQRTSLSKEKLNEINQFRQRFNDALSNDFQIPQAVAVMWEMLKSNISSNDKLALIFEMDKVLGLKINEVQEERVPQHIIDLVKELDQARNKHDYTASDYARNRIVAGGYTIENTPSGTLVKKKRSV